MLAEGTYKARAASGSLHVAQTGTESVKVLFNVDGTREQITWDGWLTEKALKHTIKALRACGWEGDDLSDMRGIDRNDVYLVVEHEEYDGKTRARVKYVNGSESGPVMALPTAESKALANKWKGAIIAERQKSGAGNGPSTGGLSAHGVPLGPDGKPLF